MAKFRIFSDLHLEHDYYNVQKRCQKLSKQIRVDNLILAGDIVDYKTRKTLLPSFIRAMEPYYKNIFYILGNHEYYRNKYSLKNDDEIVPKVIKDYRKLCNEIGITLLENDMVYLEEENLVIYGTTLWSKFSPKAQQIMNDTVSIKSSEILNAHELAQKSLETYLKTANVRTVVVTHHLPSFNFIDPRYYEENPEKGTNSGFASHSEYLFQHPITDWVYGHTHTASKFSLNGINFYCNPHGYPGENGKYRDLTF